MVELLCLDIDGTLLDSDKKLPGENIRAVQYAMDRGVKMAIASGRSIAGIEYLLEELGIEKNIIGLGGGIVYYEGKRIYESVMDGNLVQQIIDLAEKYGSDLFLSTAEYNLTNCRMEEKTWEEIDKSSLKSEHHIYDTYNELRKEAKRQQKKIVKATIKELEDTNFTLLKQELIKMGVFSVAKSDDYYVDINMRECNKGKGLKTLAEYLSIPVRHVMCVGDNENDEEMVKAAGIGVAMGNAADVVKAAADYITASNNDCGVAQAIYHFIPKDTVQEEIG